MKSGVIKTDRRASRRTEACVAVELSSETKASRCGITRNVSHNGLLVVTPSRFCAGETLELKLVACGRTSCSRGRIVRVNENGPSSEEPWRYSLAIALEGTLPESVRPTAEDASTTTDEHLKAARLSAAS